MSEETTYTAADLAAAALSYRTALDQAAQIVAGVDAELLEVRTRHHPVLVAAAADCQAARERLETMVGERRDLFGGRAKSEVVHGIHYGLRQVGGTWQWPDAQTLLAQVRARLAPSAQARVIERTEQVRRSLLTAEDRQRLGIPRSPAADIPFARAHGPDSITRLAALLSQPDADPSTDQPEADA